MADKHAATIRRLQHAGLWRLWKEIAAGATPDWPAGKAFEYLVLRAFEIEGAELRYPFSVKLASGIDEQIDGVVYAFGIAAVVESKDRGRLDMGPVTKLRSQLARRPAGVIGVILSRGGFTPPALAGAQHLAPQTILLWTGDEIDHALRKRKMLKGLEVKYRMAVERGMPDFSLLIPGVL
jgi:hypothetical protein